MNIIERHICAYIVEAITGIESDHKATIETLRATEVSKDSDSLLRLVHELVRTKDPEAESTKAIVSEMVARRAIANQAFLALRKQRRYVLSVTRNKDLIGSIYTDGEHLDEMISELRKQYPKAKIVWEA